MLYPIELWVLPRSKENYRSRLWYASRYLGAARRCFGDSVLPCFGASVGGTEGERGEGVDERQDGLGGGLPGGCAGGGLQFGGHGFDMAHHAQEVQAGCFLQVLKGKSAPAQFGQ